MRRFTENIKSLILIILGISIPILWTAYIYMQFDPTEAESPQLSNSFWIFTEDALYPETVADDSLFKPLSVSIILSGEGYTSAHNPELTDILYNSCNSLITEVFSSSYTCKKATADDWDKALGYQDFIFIEYPSQMPYTYISEFAHTTKGNCTGEICSIEKLLLFNDSRNVLSALSMDNSGKVYSFSRNTEEAPALIYDFNSNNLAAYTVNKGFIAFEFNKKPDQKRSFESLDSDYKLLFTSPDLPSVTVETPMQYTLDGVFGVDTISLLELIEDKTMSEIFNVFNINPNIAGYYSDPHTGLYFVEEDAHISVSPSGRVLYSVTDKNNPAISTSDLLNTTRTDFTSAELLTAATVFVSDFSADILGGEANPILKKIVYSSTSNEITFTFGYYYLLTEILYKGDNNAITLTFNNNGLLRADFLPLTVSQTEITEEEQTPLLPTDTLPYFAAQLLDGQNALLPIYEFDSFGKTVTPYWATGGR